MQRLSGGRFELGIGTQVKANIEERCSTPWTPPPPVYWMLDAFVPSGSYRAIAATMQQRYNGIAGTLIFPLPASLRACKEAADDSFTSGHTATRPDTGHCAGNLNPRILTV